MVPGNRHPPTQGKRRKQSRLESGCGSTPSCSAGLMSTRIRKEFLGRGGTRDEEQILVYQPAIPLASLLFQELWRTLGRSGSCRGARARYLR